MIGSFEAAIPTSVLDLNSLRWTVVDPTVLDGQSSAMYLPGKFVKSGTSATSDPPFVAAAATTYVLDMNQPNPAWRQTAPMTFPRAYHNMVLLPDGTVRSLRPRVGRDAKAYHDEKCPGASGADRRTARGS